MELFVELFFTASLALFLSFFVAKLVAVAMAVGDSDSKSTPAVSDEVLAAASRVQSSIIKSKVESIDETSEKVDHLHEEVAEVPERLVEESVVFEASREILDVSAPGSATNDAVSPSPEVVGLGVSVEVLQGKEEAGELESRLSVGDDDDWEGVDIGELENDFAAAVKFVEARGNDPANVLGSDAQMELYGLRKVATEGGCRAPMPQALDPSDQAKWEVVALCKECLGEAWDSDTGDGYGAVYHHSFGEISAMDGTPFHGYGMTVTLLC